MAKSDYYRIGLRVQLVERTPPRGTWKKYNGKTGTVVALNRPAQEVHIKVDDHAATWFSVKEIKGVVK